MRLCACGLLNKEKRSGNKYAVFVKDAIMQAENAVPPSGKTKKAIESATGCPAIDRHGGTDSSRNGEAWHHAE
jgi:hypothetical protein